MKKKRAPNTYIIIFCVIVLVAILSWIVPGGSYELDEAGRAIAGTYHLTESNPQGLWDIFMAPVIGMIGSDTMSGAIAISLTIMLFGSFLEMMDETNAIKLFLKRLTEKNQKNMYALITILVIAMGIFESCRKREGSRSVVYGE